MILLSLPARVFYCLLITVLHGPLVAASAIFDVRSITAITDDYLLEEYPVGAANVPVRLDFVVTPDEYEPASFVIHANRSVEGLKIRATALHDAKGGILDGASLDIRIVKRWYQKNFGGYSPPELKNITSELLVYDDNLIRVEDGQNFLRLENGEYINISNPDKLNKYLAPTPTAFPVRDAVNLQPIDLLGGENRQLWVTLHTPVDAPAGNYQAAIELVYRDEVEVVIPVTVEVLPFKLADPDIEYSIYYRGRLDKNRPEGSVSSEFKSEAQMLADFRNLRAHGINNPTVYQKLNTGFLDRVMELRQQADINADSLYYLGIVVISNDGVVPSRLGREVRETRSIVAEYGVSDVYFYARDEARGEELIHQLPFWEAVKEAGGKIMAAGWQNTARYPGNFDVTGGEEDLYVCLGTLSSSEAQRWHSKGKLIFSYQNPTGGYELPKTWRRNYGLLLWQAGYDGGMPYAWQHSYGNGWNDFDHYRHRDHNFTYPTLDQPIDTVQWEGFREGVDDVRYLATLAAILETEEGTGSIYADAASSWLAQLRGLPLGQSDPDEIRAQAVAHILALIGWVDESAAQLKLTDLVVAPVEPDGTVQVRWRTSVRASSELQNGNSDFDGVPRGINHAVTLADIEPGATTAFTVSSAIFAEAEPVFISGRINADPDINFTDVASTVENAEMSVSLTTRSAYRSSIGVDLGRSLLGWWRFSEPGDKLVDLSTWEHEASLKGNAEPGEGWFGAGIALNGDGGFVNLPDVDIDMNGTATVEGWFRFRSFAMDKVKNTGLFTGFYQHGDNNYFYFSRTNDHFQVGSLLHRNTWHHIALTWSGDTSSARLYIDGQAVPITILSEIETIAAINGLNIGRSGGYFGGLIGSAKNTFDGDVDEIRVWNRVLNSAEIQVSYRGGQERLKLHIDTPAGVNADWALIGSNAADQYVIQNP